MVCALSPPGCGRNDVSNRFLRHMNILGIDSFDDETLRRIFTTEVDWHFKVKFNFNFAFLYLLFDTYHDIFAIVYF